ILILLDSVLIYYRAKKASGGLMFFPVWIYIVPGLIGIVMQSLFYGISVIGPCAAISVAGLVISLQREALMKDKLTGLYNRYYLDRMNKSIPKSRHSAYTMLMLDMNRFKSINDRYGHSEGDRALITVSELLREALKDIGIIIRYAGDEFIVILFSQDDGIIRQQTDKIEKALSDYNAAGSAPYELSVSIGYCVMDLDQHSINEVLSIADNRMYENKTRLYAVTGQK
ncbi:MAG: GGDEF domain-containing protein, partial [Clostridiales bacterium]|nr:GGDEF domain-containing protein [Clostridiales bacterium]